MAYTESHENPRQRDPFHLHFIDKETEIQSGEDFSPGLTAGSLGAALQGCCGPGLL